MWFAGEAPAAIEPRVPVEGESFNPEAYSIYNWKGLPKDGDADPKSAAEETPPAGS